MIPADLRDPICDLPGKFYLLPTVVLLWCSDKSLFGPKTFLCYFDGEWPLASLPKLVLPLPSLLPVPGPDF